MAGLSIGEFARASGLTPKALRLYDELGLLRPARVASWSGYRSYDRDQLDRARLVASLRGLGMPLARIRVVADLPPAAAATEVASYWRQVEADTAARRQLATHLVRRLTRKDNGMPTEARGWLLDSATHVDGGPVRPNNQDVVFAGRRLQVVADGFGAPGSDRTASAAAVEALRVLDRAEGHGDVAVVLGDAVSNAAEAVREFGSSAPELAEAGTTVTAMLWSGSRFALAHIGDSRAYLLRDGEFSQLTHDHTFVQSLVDEGRLTAEEAAAHPRRAALLRALTLPGTGEPDFHLREARPGDRYLLCTDGLHAVIPEPRLRGALLAAGTPTQTVNRLGELVRQAGAPDNTACAVTDVLGPP
ncbi:MerR family transcriptional regulator [Actinoalloteichus caeruleus]|uniref:MerR family transcriptional regulator n=1 Tax=Actinoalloteichus cyanogriseus TaxID=2893586 RepID=UPI0004AB4BC3|nr:MerR family transcriptional regulator [Actinoalloteichus caeruleus]